MARPRQISDERILETARQCFFEHGPSVSTDVIAEKLGVSSQALFKRFSSKRQLMLAAIRPADVPPWAEKLENGPDARPFHVQLKEVVNELAIFFEDVTQRMSFIRWSNIPIEEIIGQHETPPPVTDIRILAGWLQRAHRNGLIRKVDFEATSLSLLSSLHGPAFLEDMLGQHPTGHSRRQYVNRVVDLYTTALSTDDEDHIQNGTQTQKVAANNV